MPSREAGRRAGLFCASMRAWWRKPLRCARMEGAMARWGLDSRLPTASGTPRANDRRAGDPATPWARFFRRSAAGLGERTAAGSFPPYRAKSGRDKGGAPPLFRWHKRSG